jgi:hypothetical protein
MISPSMRRLAYTLALVFAFASLPAFAGEKPEQPVKPLAGPRATVLRITWLYITPDTHAQKIDRVQIGREMVVSEKNGAWLRVYANTDIEQLREGRDTPVIGEDETPSPISGWIEARGVVAETNSNGDQILMGAAAIEEALASDPRGPVNAAQSARLLYRRVAEMYPNSPLAAEARWRAADIQWQLQKADNATLPSSREKQAYLRIQLDETDLKKIVKTYPRTRWAALAAFDLLDNKLCGSWQGSAQCPEKEADLYIKYAGDYPDGPRTARALYEAVYRLAALKDMYDADENQRKSSDARNQARSVAAQLKAHFSDSDYCWQANAMVYKLDEGLPVYGIDRGK